MIYYFILALIDIYFFLTEHWKELTFTALASGIGVILGKRIGVKFAVNYIMKSMGLQQESLLEQQHNWLMKQEEARGNRWIAPISKPYRINIRQVLFKYSILSRMERSIARFTKLRMNLRRKSKMLLALRNPWSKKLFAFIVLVLLNGLNDTLQLHLSPDTINRISTLGMTYIVSQAGVDALKPLIMLILAKFSVNLVGGSVDVKPTIDTESNK